jgi:hypothetical protein
MATKRKVWLSAIASIALIAVVGLGLAFKPVGNIKKVAAKKSGTMYTFAYNGPDFSVANVENEANWSYTSSTDLCDGIDVKPCRIQVSESFVNNPGTAPTLKSTANVSATLNSTFSTAYVDGLDDPDGVISNRPN